MPQPIPWFIEFDQTELWLIAFVLVLSLLDIVSGLVQALINRDFQSSRMREGLGHKAVLVLVIVLSVVVQGFAAHVGDSGWDVPLIYPTCLYIAVMEVSSVIENVALAYPELAGSKLLRLFRNSCEETEEKG